MTSQMFTSQETLDELYTPSQLEAYFTHISFPKDRHINTKTASESECLAYLSLLTKHQLSTIPFENLSMHYSANKHISLNKEDLFTKIVILNNGRGGHCMENNMFFATILKSLNFNVTAVGARVANSDGVSGNHRVNIINIHGTLYLSDVGFGGNGITRPMALIHDSTSPWGRREASNRLTYAPPSNSSFTGLWTLSHRKSPPSPWNTAFTFSLTEFLPGDFEVMNLSIKYRVNSWLVGRVVCVRFLLDEEGEDFVGALILDGGNVRRKMLEEVEVLEEMVSEEERVAALKKYFGIELSDAEVAGIQGAATELKEVPSVG